MNRDDDYTPEAIDRANEQADVDGVPAPSLTVERPLPVDGQGPRITELWAWTSLDPMTDTEGIVAVKTARGGGLPLVTTMREMADRYGPLAQAAVEAAQEPRPTIRLRHFVPAEDDD